VAAEVVVQAMAMVFAIAGLGKWVNSGGVFDKSVMESAQSPFPEVIGFMALGFIVAGIATVRARRWDGWRRYVPHATGISFAALIGLAVTPALAIAVALYGICLTAFGVALWTQPTPSSPRPRTEAVQVKL
jgi:uncharacterized membrane protein YphA (DoxX/SURF4 family)